MIAEFQERYDIAVSTKARRSMRILFIGNKTSVFIQHPVHELNKKKIPIHVFDPYSLTLYDHEWRILRQFRSLPTVLDQIPKFGYIAKLCLLLHTYRKFKGQYAICHIHYHLKEYSDISRTIRKIGKKLVVSVWGSDFYKRNDRDRRIQKKIYTRADRIIFANEIVKKDFLDHYGHKFEKKCRILRFGLRPLDHIKKLLDEDIATSKKRLNIPPDTLIITCGSCATPNQNHNKILEALLSIEDKLPNNVLCVFPLTYGHSEYRKKIMPLLNQAPFPIHILDNFLSEDDVARLRKMTDIMINVQEMDQLSGAMTEHLYAGSIVLAGGWLPYDIWKEKGAFFLTVNRIEELGDRIEDALMNLETYKTKAEHNASIAFEIGNWTMNISQWISLYHSLVDAG